MLAWRTLQSSSVFLFFTQKRYFCLMTSLIVCQYPAVRVSNIAQITIWNIILDTHNVTFYSKVIFSKVLFSTNPNVAGPVLGILFWSNWEPWKENVHSIKATIRYFKMYEWKDGNVHSRKCCTKINRINEGIPLNKPVNFVVLIDNFIRYSAKP